MLLNPAFDTAPPENRSARSCVLFFLFLFWLRVCLRVLGGASREFIVEFLSEGLKFNSMMGRLGELPQCRIISTYRSVVSLFQIN